jgi:hypothetical protein
VDASHRFTLSHGVGAVVFFHTAAPRQGRLFPEECPFMCVTMSESLNEVNACRTSAISTNGDTPQPPAWHGRFLQLLPAIRQHAWVCFRGVDPESREEAIQEVVANALVAYARLVELDNEGLAYADPLARYAVAQFRVGRRVGGRLNIRDVMSRYCRNRKGVVVEQLDHAGEETGEWLEIAIEDRHSGPAEIAALRIDFRNWLETLSPRNRRLTETLALGETTSRVAEMFAISAGRVSQLRRELHAAWQLFTGELGAA